MISGGWTEKSTGESGATIGGSGATTEGICASFGKDLRQRRKRGRHGSERARQRGDVPKRQHYERYDDNERQDHNTDAPFEFHHSQENNKALTKAQVCYAHVAEEERNKQNQRSEDGDNLEVTQKGAHMEFDCG